MNGKGNGPRKGYNYQKYAENYDQIFRTMKPNQDETSMTTKQPAPVLAWHREAAKEVRETIDRLGRCYVTDEGLAAIIAAHDPHAITLGLLEDALPYVARDDFGSLLARDIRAHIADMKGTQ